MSFTNYGIDVGNYDTKSANTSITSGFKTYTSKPELGQEYIIYDNKCYVLTKDRFKYKMDKTEDEQALILTLFSLAKETIFRVNRGSILSHEQQQAKINKYTNINLGVGVPPLHCNLLSQKTKEYYQRNMEHIKFQYCGFDFERSLNEVYVFPQAYAAVQNNKRCSFITEYPKIFLVDIGGYTVDVLAMINGQPDVSIVDSKPLGVLRLYQEIKKEVLRVAGFSVDDFIIETVLTGKQHTLSNDIAEIMFTMAERWCDQIINELRESGIEFKVYPVVFMGGGSLLFKRNIHHNALVGKHEFITNTHANALGYERLLNMLIPAK